MTIIVSYILWSWQLQFLLYRRILYQILIPTWIFRHRPLILITHNSTMMSAALSSLTDTKMMSKPYPMVHTAS